MTINVKSQEAETIEEWDKSMVFCSNEFPGFRTKAGSGARRIVITSFNHPIKHVETDMETHLIEELPFYVIKCRLRYLRGLKEYGTKSLWDKKENGEYIMPQMVRDNAKEYTAQNSLPDAFLESDLVDLACKHVDKPKDFKCSIKEFKEVYNDWKFKETQDPRKKRYPTPCDGLNFGYPLQMRECEWVEETGMILGLKVKPKAKTTNTTNTSKTNSTHF